jgi:hypothetical protein
MNTAPAEPDDFDDQPERHLRAEIDTLRQCLQACMFALEECTAGRPYLRELVDEIATRSKPKRSKPHGR